MLMIQYFGKMVKNRRTRTNNDFNKTYQKLFSASFTRYSALTGVP